MHVFLTLFLANSSSFSLLKSVLPSFLQALQKNLRIFGQDLIYAQNLLNKSINCEENRENVANTKRGDISSNHESVLLYLDSLTYQQVTVRDGKYSC